MKRKPVPGRVLSFDLPPAPPKEGRCNVGVIITYFREIDLKSAIPNYFVAVYSVGGLALGSLKPTFISLSQRACPSGNAMTLSGKYV